MIQKLLEFEQEHQELYDIQANGMPIYTVLRQDVYELLNESEIQYQASGKKGRIYPKRILDGLIKMYRFRNKETLIFTTSIFRRDKQRNLAAEYLLDNYVGAGIFEWPSRDSVFDLGYFKDEKREQYCPLDFYLLLKKFDRILYRKQYNNLINECKNNIEGILAGIKETKVREFLSNALPSVYADTIRSQVLFKRLYKKYSETKIIIDFWGAARENIFPIFSSSVQLIELQHGVISLESIGYIYPKFVRYINAPIFERKILVYGDYTKRLLTEESIFDNSQIDIIGNPRLIRYNQMSCDTIISKEIILFTSQPYTLPNYYPKMVKLLNEFNKAIKEVGINKKLGIKLHPREDVRIGEYYKQHINEVEIYDASVELYDLLKRSFVHLTVSSTTLYEAAEFDTPTIVLVDGYHNSLNDFGFPVWTVEEHSDILNVLTKLQNVDTYHKYVNYLKVKVKEYL